MKTQDHTSCRGFSLVELLIVAAIIGLIVAIAIPNLLNALNRSRQSRTVSDMRTLSNGLGIYNQDYAQYPTADSFSDFSAIAPDLVPFIGEGIPVLDAWRFPLQYKSDGQSYTLVSYGLDGTADTPWTSGLTSLFEADIVILDGAFFQIPEGAQN
jgi:general secretion pathway protein G